MNLRRSSMHLVCNHVLQALVIDRPKEDVTLHRFTRNAICKVLLAVVRVSVCDKSSRDIVDPVIVKRLLRE